MIENNFQEGDLTYTIETITPDDLAARMRGDTWHGYIAFSKRDISLHDPSSAKPISTAFLKDRINESDGFVMEVNIWRSDGTVLEEIAAEREENNFFVQHWKLETKPKVRTGNCLHRQANTVAASRLYSGDLKSVEVVWPEHRLNFFITTEEV